jgi:GntR family transcriptional regulator
LSPASTGALNRSGPTPLWAQLEADLRERLHAGDFDERFPTDHELMEQYGVSRHTVRHAVSKLGADGLLQRRRGVGSAVDRHRFEQSLGSLYSLFRVVEASGAVQRSYVLTLTSTTDAEAAAHLGLEHDADLVHLARIRYADGEPLAIDRLWLPQFIAEALLTVDFTHTGLYDELELATGQRPSSGWERITPIMPSPDDRQRLGIDTDQAVFCLQRLACIDSQPVEWRVTTIRGDRFSFVADWTSGQSSSLQLTTHGREMPAR